jgi:hypothetical protein
VITIRIKILEIFLSKILILLNIPIYYSHEYIKKSPTHIKIKNNEKIKRYEYDILIGSDGVNSKVRRDLNFTFEKQNKIYLKNYIHKKVELIKNDLFFVNNLFQSTLIINFNVCLPLIHNFDEIILDPWFFFYLLKKKLKGIF